MNRLDFAVAKAYVGDYVPFFIKKEGRLAHHKILVEPSLWLGYAPFRSNNRLSRMTLSKRVYLNLVSGTQDFHLLVLTRLPIFHLLTLIVGTASESYFVWLEVNLLLDVFFG